MKTVTLFLISICCLLPLSLFGQRGKIIRTATTNVMDPDGDGYITQTHQSCLDYCASLTDPVKRANCIAQCPSCTTQCTFSSDGYNVDEFEINMFPIPQLGSGDVTSDNIGNSCGITDLIPDSKGQSVYAVHQTSNNQNNLIFRFRVGDDNPSVESWTILLDTDGLFGANDPNATADNPGFEIDITLIKRNNAGVYVYNIDGIQSCPTPRLSYPISSNFQISIGDLVTCGDPDYFYDYFVSFSDIASAFNISTSTGLRFAAVTNVSATCAMSGNIADVSGVDNDDPLYSGCVTCAFNDLIANQCPTPIIDLCQTCGGFQKDRVNKPTINVPVRAGQTIISGTSDFEIYIVVEIYPRIGGTDALPVWSATPRETKGNYAVGTNWSVTLTTPLQAYDKIVAKAQKNETSVPCGSAGGNLASVEVTVVQPNTRPSAQNQTVSVVEDTPKSIILIGTDPENDPLIYTIITSPIHGVLTGTAPNLTYTPNLNYDGSDSFTFQVSDGIFSSVLPGIVTINFTPVNDPPVAVNDITTTNEDVLLNGNVLINDSDIEGNTLTVTQFVINSVTYPAGNTATIAGTGTLLIIGNGNFTFTPLLNSNGPVPLATYTIIDGNGGTANATLSIIVSSVNDAPIATNDSGTTNEDTPVTISNITANDIDVDGTVNTASVDLDPSTAGIQNTLINAGGTWSVTALGAVTYAPNLNFNGITSVTYVVNDNLGATSAPASITITVNAVNDAPVAVNDNSTTNEDTPVTLNITTNDTDVDGTINVATVDLDLLTSGIQNTFTNVQGNWTVNGLGDVTYTPALNFNGTATKSYTVNDNLGATSNTANITITVTALNDPPIANNDTGTTSEDVPVTLTNITANDTDVEGAVNTSSVDLNLVTPGIQNTFSNAPGNWNVDASGNVTYSPALNFNGTTTINYQVNDNLGSTSGPATITIVVNPVNDAPVATNDTGSTNEDNPVTLISINANDTDVDGAIDAATIDLDLSMVGIQNSFVNAQGSWSVTALGNLTYTPTLNFNGSASINYTINDNSGTTSGPAVINITVNPVNDAPVANNDSGTTYINTTVTLFAITSNDTDVDGTINLATIDLDPGTGGIQNSFSNAGGSWAVNGSGDITFTPTLAFSGITTIFYTVKDNLGTISNPASIAINVSGVDPNAANIPPVANNDSGSTNEDTPVILLDVTSNDTDADGTINKASVDFDPLASGIQNTFTNSYGTWNVNALADVTFTPVLDFVGIATKSYIVNDNLGTSSNLATISITVINVNDPPVAVDDNATTDEDTPVMLLAITGNDTDSDGTVSSSTIDIDLVSGGIQNTFSNAQGGWSVNGAGDLTFNPASNFNGQATVSYVVNDNLNATSAPATVRIQVNSVNDKPVATDNTGTTDEDYAITLLSITANDSDVDGTLVLTTVDLDPSTAGVQITLLTGEGSWSVNATADVTFTPVLNFNGIASIVYTVNDNESATSAPAVIIITVTSDNDLPIATNDSGTTNEDTPITILNITTNDSDVDGVVTAATVDIDILTGGIQSTFLTAEGSWSVSPTGNVTFSPVLNYNGTTFINYTVDDNQGATSNTANITIVVNSVNDAPIAINDNGSTNEDVAVTLSNITANDSDADGTIDMNTLDIDLLTTGIQNTFLTAQGSWSANNLGELTFTPVLNFNGTAVVSYTINDNTGASSTFAVVTVVVNPIDDAPIAYDKSVVTSEDVAIAITLTGSDIDGDVFTYAIVSQPTHGALSGTAPNFTYTPTADYNGSDILTFKINASNTDSNLATVSITITPVSDSPIAFNQNGIPVTTPENIPKSIVLVGNDPDGDIINYIIVSGPLHGVLSGTGANVVYTPASDYNGPDSFTFKVNDGTTDSNIATVLIAVTPESDVPIANNQTLTTDEDVPKNILLTATDADGDPLTYSVVTQPTNGTLAGTGTTLKYTPALNYFGFDSFSFKANDGSTDSNPGTISIEVISVNDPPVITSLPVLYTMEDSLLQVCLNVVDPEGDEIIFSTPSNASGGGSMVRDVAPFDFCYIFTPDFNFNGESIWDMQVSDIHGLVGKASVTIIVGPVNDAPILTNILATTEINIPVIGTLFRSEDIDPEGTELNVDLVPQKEPSNGVILINADGSYTYTPDLNFLGEDAVTIQMCDSGIPLPGACASKVLTINVTAINTLPPGTLSLSTPEDTPISFCYDYVDPQGDNITPGSITNISGGGSLNVTNSADLCFQFLPTLNFNGISEWEIEICDDGSPSLCTKLKVIIDITPVNDPPVAVRDSIRVLRKVLHDGNVVTNDYDIEDVALSVTTTPLKNVEHGELILNSDGRFTYISDKTFRGIDSLIYEVCDNGTPVGCSTATLVINVEDLPFKVYEGITPNGDGTNDYLRIEGIDFYPNCLVRIFDRFNNLVFEISGYNNEEKVWSGFANKGIGDNVLQEGTYFYTVNLGDGSATASGFVALKRD